MGTEHTPHSTIEKLLEESSAHGFTPFHVKKTSTGYIYNRYGTPCLLLPSNMVVFHVHLTLCRIWAAIKRESLLALSEGVATPAEIDGIFKDVLKTPKGPCEQMDIVGLDVVRDIEQHYADVREGLPEEPRRLLDEYIREKNLGVKSGRGFYEWRDGKKVDV